MWHFQVTIYNLLYDRCQDQKKYCCLHLINHHFISILYLLRYNLSLFLLFSCLSKLNLFGNKISNYPRKYLINAMKLILHMVYILFNTSAFSCHCTWLKSKLQCPFIYENPQKREREKKNNKYKARKRTEWGWKINTILWQLK